LINLVLKNINLGPVENLNNKGRKSGGKGILLSLFI
jgi:hypothetical protein